METEGEHCLGKENSSHQALREGRVCYHFGTKSRSKCVCVCMCSVMSDSL